MLLDEMKIALATPILTADDESEVDNFRPITVT